MTATLERRLAFGITEWCLNPLHRHVAVRIKAGVVGACLVPLTGHGYMRFRPALPGAGWHSLAEETVGYFNDHPDLTTLEAMAVIRAQDEPKEDDD